MAIQDVKELREELKRSFADLLFTVKSHESRLATLEAKTRSVPASSTSTTHSIPPAATPSAKQSAKSPESA